MTDTIFKPPVYKCMVEGCENEMDPGSTQSLCRPCYEVITTGNTDRYYVNHQGSTWIRQIISWNYNLRQEVEELEYNQEHAYSFEDGTMSLNDLRNFYVAHKNQALGPPVIDKRLLKDAHDALDKKNMENIFLRDVIRDLEKDHKYKSEIIDNLRKEIDRGNLDHYNNVILKKGHEQKDQHIDSLRKEIEALNYNIDHAHKDGDKFLSVDDLCIFYTENKNVYDLAERQRNHMVLLELQMKKANETIKHQDETIQAFKKELDSMEDKLAKKENFTTNTEDKFAQRAKINEEKQNVKFEGYTEGFWKGADFGWAKAKEQFDD